MSSRDATNIPHTQRNAIVARFCKDHKEPTTVDVIHNLCEQDGCDKRPTYANKGTKRPRFCCDHKKSTMVDVITKRCEQDGCETIAIYGIPVLEASSCARHRSAGMIALPRKRCYVACCNNIGIHGKGDGEGSKRSIRFCEEHAPPDYVDIMQYICSSCGLLDILRGGMCADCDFVARITYGQSK